jgi:hypothetical protein
MKGPWEFENAPCTQVGVNVFFAQDRDDPESNGTRDSRYRDAKKGCSTCEYKTDCAIWGLANETHGVWGGLTPKERNLIKKQGKERFVLDTASLKEVEYLYERRADFNASANV